MLALSMLDQSPIRSGGTPAQAIRETLELAEACDRLGYHRSWLAEHHSDQLVIVSIAHHFKARLRSYELLAEPFQLPRDP